MINFTFSKLIIDQQTLNDNDIFTVELLDFTQGEEDSYSFQKKEDIGTFFQNIEKEVYLLMPDNTTFIPGVVGKYEGYSVFSRSGGDEIGSVRATLDLTDFKKNAKERYPDFGKHGVVIKAHVTLLEGTKILYPDPVDVSLCPRLFVQEVKV
jgi:hypothetical protein